MLLIFLLLLQLPKKVALILGGRKYLMESIHLFLINGIHGNLCRKIETLVRKERNLGGFVLFYTII